MPNAKFDSKSFNAEAFKYMVGRVPNLKLNEIKKSKALAGNPDIKDAFSGQGGTGYARIAMRGLADGAAVNYDGSTNITASATKTFEQGVVVVGRAKGFVERDFSYDITGGEDFMADIAKQIAEYKDGLDQDTILATLEGVFNMGNLASPDAKSKEFVDKHTFAINDVVGATTLNSAINKACGANKKKFSLVFMNSDVATGLENKNLVEHLKYTDADGVQRDLELYTWNGRLVIVDDDMPVLEDAHFDAESTTEGALEIVADSATPDTGEIKLKDAKKNYFGDKTLAAGDYVLEVDLQVSYILGDGAIQYEDIGAKVPYEMARDAATNGGQDTLYVRQRKVFAPYGISYEKASQSSASPTDTELKNGANWVLVHSGEASAASRTYLNHKAVPIARILSIV